MARCPFAVWRPLTENTTQPLMTATQAILHSAVDGPGRTSLYGYFQNGTSLESHFYIYMDGTIEQYIDTARTADANFHANVRAISIETEDDGLEQPWSAAQLVSIKRLLNWICVEHPKVLRRQCPAWDQPGIGWHSMWGAPSNWTPAVGKTCPRTIRIKQIPDILAAVVKPASTPKPAVPSVPAEQEQDDEDVKQIVWYSDPARPTARHAYYVVSNHGKHLTPKALNLLRFLKVPEVATLLGADWQRSTIIHDGPCKNI